MDECVGGGGGGCGCGLSGWRSVRSVGVGEPPFMFSSGLLSGGVAGCPLR
jgi:hypothetical protein